MFPRKLMNSISHDLSIHLRGKKNAQELNRKQFRKLVGATGFEPATPCAQGRCATRLRYAPTLRRPRQWRRPHLQILAQPALRPMRRPGERAKRTRAWAQTYLRTNLPGHIPNNCRPCRGGRRVRAITSSPPGIRLQFLFRPVGIFGACVPVGLYACGLFTRRL